MGSTRNKVGMCVAAVTLAAGALAAITSGPMAHAATPDCGSCIELFSLQYGSGDIASVNTGAAQSGETVLLAAAGQYSAEDFKVIKEGLVSGLYQKGIVGNVVDEYPNDLAYQYVYAPDGVLSGLCMGIASSPYSDEAVTLEPCGVDANTIWVSMFEDESDTGYFPLINGADTLPDTPFVMTVTRSKYWILNFSLDLIVVPLEVTSGTVASSQMWASDWGVEGG